MFCPIPRSIVLKLYANLPMDCAVFFFNLLIDYTLYIIEILGNGIFQEQIYRNIISCRIAWRNFSLNNPTVYCIVHANYLVQYTDVFHNVLQPTVQDIGVLCRLV